MVRVITSVAPRYGNWWRLLAVCALLLSLLLAQPLVARADDDGKESFTTTATIFIADPGHVMPIGGNKFRTTGEVILGCISSTTWNLIPVVAGACTPASTNLSVSHASVTTVSPTGLISGRAQGGFSVGAFRGTYNGDISAQLVPVNPTTQIIAWIKDSGTWNASDRHGNTAKGTFTLAMQWNSTLGTLVGTLTLKGVRKSHDD